MRCTIVNVIKVISIAKPCCMESQTIKLLVEFDERIESRYPLLGGAGVGCSKKNMALKSATQQSLIFLQQFGS